MSLVPGKRYARVSSFVPSWQHARSVDYSVGTDESTATEQWDIQPNFLLAFTADLLGWSRKDGTRIFRKAPAQHPVYASMYANRISKIEGLGPTGMTDGQSGPYANFKLLRLTVNYNTPNYKIIGAPNGGDPDPFLADAANKEWMRYLVPVDYEANTQFIQAKKGAFWWPATAPQGRISIPETAGGTLVYTKTKIAYQWMFVPDIGLFPSGFDTSKKSTNIDNAIGTVNLTSFMGFPAQTLLLEAWKPIPVTQPLAAGVAPVAGPGRSSSPLPRAWHVKLMFSYFEVAAARLGVGATGGHNLVPNPEDNLWYRVQLGGLGDSSAYWKYATSDFDLIFQMN